MSEQEKLCKIALESGTYEARPTKKFLQRKPYEAPDPCVVKAQIPGVVAQIDSVVGQSVKQGDTLMILEAMKMLNRIKAPQDGVIKAIHVAAGEKITKGQELIRVE